MKYLVQYLVICFFATNLIWSQENIEAKIITKTVDNFIDIKGLAINIDDTYKDEYSYLLFALKKGANNNYSRNNQSGEFSLSPGEQKELSKMSINIQKGEECKIYLFIRKNKVLISKDSAVVYSAEYIKDKEYIDESDIEIKGLVFGDVKTKFGKDFYDLFYQNYLGSGANHPFIININEKPSIGTSSRISLIVDDRILFEFMTRPNSEYIEMAAKQAISKVKSYATQRKLLYRSKKI